MQAQQTCRGTKNGGGQCGTRYELDKNGYCSHHGNQVLQPPVKATTCLGIRNDGKPCGWKSPLAPNGYCRHHQDQFEVDDCTNSEEPSSDGEMTPAIPPDENSDVAGEDKGIGSFTWKQCRGRTRKGARCAISWDLNPRGFCEYHRGQSPVECATSGARHNHSLTNIDTSRICGSRGSSTPGLRDTVDPNEPNLGVMKLIDLTKKNASSLPALWSVTHDKTRDKLVLRMYSEVSRECFHKPIEIKRSGWANWGKMTQAAVQGLHHIAGLVPMVGPLLQAGTQGGLDRCAYANSLDSYVVSMNIDKGGTYYTEGVLYSQQDLDDRRVLKELLRLYDSNFDYSEIALISSLLCTSDKDGLPIWDHRDEVSDKLVRAPKPIQVFALYFERVMRPWFKTKVNVTINWELLRDTEMLEQGRLCVGAVHLLAKVNCKDIDCCSLRIVMDGLPKWPSRSISVPIGKLKASKKVQIDVTHTAWIHICEVP